MLPLTRRRLSGMMKRKDFGCGARRKTKKGFEVMDCQLGRAIRVLRKRKKVSQEELAESLGVSMQAVSKWETGKANPDLFLLPALAEFFSVSIDALFSGPGPEDGDLPKAAAQLLEANNEGWTQILQTDWKGTHLPCFGPYTPTEEELHLFGSLNGKAVLELACGTGESLLWMARHGAKERWGLDISEARIAQAEELLRNRGIEVKLFVSPMEQNPGIPERHFDLVYSVYGLGWTMDLERTVSLASAYLKPGGRFVFSWDNPLMQCIDAENGGYRLSRSYVEEREVDIWKKGAHMHLRNWKLSSYLNCLAGHGFLIERVVEESSYDPEEAEVFLEGKYYAAGKAKLLNPTVIVKARKL